ncbi:MAG: hypothetical protein GF331_09110 [Chitinivibrionales bacterium]|nr:hypothetical protein [Chitinivibrionales bacterium]
MALLDIEQKKGDPQQLDGRLTVYARVELDPSDLVEAKHPVASMIHNGLLVAQGNFREQYSLRDFLQSEMGVSLEEGLEQLLSRLDGIESALDPDKLKEKLKEMEGMEDFIPTPAKIMPFHSEQEIMAQEGDVFYTGSFRSIGSAVLSVNAFPILYQARYREHMMDNVRAEIDRLVGQVETSEAPSDRYDAPDVDIEQRLMREYIPNMLYCRKEKGAFEAAKKQFRAFMDGYRYGEDVDAMVSLIETQDLTKEHFRRLELYARKVAAVRREDFEEAERIQRELQGAGRSSADGGSSEQG